VGLRALPAAVSAAYRAGAIGFPLAAPPEEARVGGLRHSLRRDTRAVTHHYDVGNNFYELILGPTMTYSCARFADPAMSLEQAQESKHELICRKLGLPDAKGMRLLDVGCGWGTMAMHAASNYGATVVGITLSGAQADYARQRVAASGLSDRVEIRVQDTGNGGRAVRCHLLCRHVRACGQGAHRQVLRDAARPFAAWGKALEPCNL